MLSWQHWRLIGGQLFLSERFETFDELRLGAGHGEGTLLEFRLQITN
jgi:hypothetical protein